VLLSEAELRGEIANTVKFVQSTSEVAIAVKFAAGELRDDSYYRIPLSVLTSKTPLPWGEAIAIHCKAQLCNEILLMQSYSQNKINLVKKTL
jgi:hypothetical protein